MRLLSLFFCLGLFLMSTLSPLGHAQTKLRDILDIEGVRTNDLVGYGIVVGLNGSGDSVRNAPFTEDALSHMLERLGVNVQGEQIKPNNVAAVLVTASLPAFSRRCSLAVERTSSKNATTCSPNKKQILQLKLSAFNRK